MALCGALPFVHAGGSALAHAAVRDRALARWLAPGITLAGWLSAQHVVGLVTGSFHVALFGATVLLGLLGVLAWRRSPRSAWPSPSPRLWIGAGVATALIAPLAFGWAFHDELFFTGHLSIAAAIENGPYPPRHLTFPSFELRYHYGFDLLVAAIASLARLPTSIAIDVVTLAAWAYTFCLLWILGERHVGEKRGLLVAVVTLFGAGLPFFSVPAGAPWVYRLLGVAAVDEAFTSPPLVSYFFQHPWALGLPLALTALHLALSDHNTHARLATLALLTLALALSQFVLFASLPPALVASELVSRDRRRALALAGALGAAALAAVPLGGFFAAAPEDAARSLVLRAGVTGSAGGDVEWHLASFGALLPLGIAGLWWTARLRVVLGTLAAGALVVVNVVRYTHSWDIVKFAAVASLALSIGAAAAVARLCPSTGGTPRRALAALLVAVCTAGGFSFVAALALRLPGIPEAVFHRAPLEASSADAAAIGWLRARVAAGEIVYRNQSAGHAYAQWGGLAQPWIDAMTLRFGFSEARVGRRLWLLQTLPADPDPWVAEGIVWLVLEPSDVTLRGHADAWRARGRAELAAEHGELLVYRLE